MGFMELGLNELLVEKLTASGIAEPTNVQKQALPELLNGRDGVIVSPTGTGKTLAYLLPLLQKIDGSRREVQALVLAPTQELAMQIMREAEAYGQPLGIKATALIGGASLARQLERMKSKPALIVGTPGRVREVSNSRKLSLHAVSFVVVDETDRVFSLGGKSDVEVLMKQCNRERQTVFVSATRSPAMREAESQWQNDAWVSDVTEKENENGLSSTLEHWYFLSDRREKIDLIRKIVRHMKPTSALLFVNDTEKIGELQAKLRYEGVSVDALYGDTRGQERGEVMQRFRQGRTRLLIATDVAARGLDLPGLPLVIHFEPALDKDHYVHRSGRTARMGRAGTSISLITHEERFILDKLEKQLNIEILPKMLYEGKVVSLEEGIERKSLVSDWKAPSNAGGAKDGRLVWKSKAEYMATLKPQGEKQPRKGDDPQSQAKPYQDKASSSSASRQPYASKPTDKRTSPVSDATNTAKRSYPSASSSERTDRAANSPYAGTGKSDKAGSSSYAASAKTNKSAKAPLAGAANSTKSAKAPIKPAKAKVDRKRDLKNKGAPKWLKEKRETSAEEKK